MKNLKRALCMLCVIVFVALMSISVAFAADSSPGADTPYVSWEFLGTMAGAVAATTLIVQFLKVPIDKVWKIPTRFIVYLIALIILLAVECVTQGGLVFDRVGLIIVNAVIVATTSMGAYAQTIKYME